MRCFIYENNVCLYRSKRRGFLHYVKGVIRDIAKELFDTEVEIELLDHETEDNMEHVIMRLHFNNIAFNKSVCVSMCTSVYGCRKAKVTIWLN